MSENHTAPAREQYRPDDEIDLVGLISTLWEGKWIIISITALASSIALIVLMSMPSKFIATTPIKPVASFKSDAFSKSNAHGFFTVSSDELLNAFLEQLDDRSLFAEATSEFMLIDRDEFGSEADYDEAVLKFTESLQLLPPVNEDGLARGVSRRDWQLVADYYDREKWLLALQYVERRANQEIAKILRNRFATALAVAENERDFAIQDLETKISNISADFDLQMAKFKTRLAFDLEDVSTQIDNAFIDYDRTTSDRLAFLREQAAIARKLGVAKNTIEAQTFAAQNSILASVDTDTPFYLRGYEAIEKEIELMESREDKRAFVSGLMDLEKTKRKLDQDQTLQRKEQEKRFLDSRLALDAQVRSLIQDQTLERAKGLFQETPAWSGEGFEAAAFTPEGTIFRPTSAKLTVLVLVGLLSGVVSCIYVLAASALWKSKASEG